MSDSNVSTCVSHLSAGLIEHSQTASGRGEEVYGSSERAGSGTLGSGTTGGPGFGNKYTSGTQEAGELPHDYGTGSTGGASSGRMEPYTDHTEYGSGATGGAGFGNKSTGPTDSDYTYGGNPETGRNSDPYVGHGEYGSGATGGPGYGNKSAQGGSEKKGTGMLSDKYHKRRMTDALQNDTDSTSGKMMEKLGAMMGNEKMKEKGTMKREEAGHGT